MVVYSSFPVKNPPQKERSKQKSPRKKHQTPPRKKKHIIKQHPISSLCTKTKTKIPLGTPKSVAMRRCFQESFCGGFYSFLERIFVDFRCFLVRAAGHQFYFPAHPAQRKPCLSSKYVKVLWVLSSRGPAQGPQLADLGDSQISLVQAIAPDHQTLATHIALKGLRTMEFEPQPAIAKASKTIGIKVRKTYLEAAVLVDHHRTQTRAKASKKLPGRALESKTKEPLMAHDGPPCFSLPGQSASRRSSTGSDGSCTSLSQLIWTKVSRGSEVMKRNRFREVPK